MGTNYSTHRCLRDFSIPFNISSGSSDRCHSVIETAWRPVSPSDIEYYGARSRAYCGFSAHSIRPETVDQAFFECVCRCESEIYGRPHNARYRPNLNLVSYKIDACGDEQALEPQINPRGSSNSPALHDRKVISLWFKVAPHDKEPIHSLTLCTEQLDAFPFGKRAERRVSRPCNKIYRTAPQCRVGAIDWKDELKLCRYSFVLQDTKLNRCDRGEVGIRDQIGNCDLHDTSGLSFTGRTH